MFFGVLGEDDEYSKVLLVKKMSIQRCSWCVLDVHHVEDESSRKIIPD